MLKKCLHIDMTFVIWLGKILENALELSNCWEFSSNISIHHVFYFNMSKCFIKHYEQNGRYKYNWVWICSDKYQACLTHHMSCYYVGYYWFLNNPIASCVLRDDRSDEDDTSTPCRNGMVNITATKRALLKVPGAALGW